MNLTGHWTGLLGQSDKTYDFSMEVDITQQGNLFKGIARYVTGDGHEKYAIYNISGKVTGNEVRFVDLNITDENSNTNGTWYWCKKIGIAKLKRVGDSLIISGTWENDNYQVYFGKELRQGYGCAPGVFKLSHYSPIKKTELVRVAIKPVFKTVEKNNEKVKLQIKKETLLKTAQIASKRNTKLKTTIEVQSDNIQLEFYDDNQIDGDTITVYFDGKALIYQKALSFSPLKCSLKIQRNTDHELIMFADNQGIFGENTAKLVIYDGSQAREVSMHSNMKESQSLIFRRNGAVVRKP
ncbi:hypothetical protein ASF92_09130 [Pedobacter sp. Leaf176]|nr:hypothetical protein ASF92_09130 [Pedobacter sp. Leaf176]